MQKEALLREIGRTLRAILDRGLSMRDRKTMDMAVENFLKDELADCTTQELLDRFITSQGSARQFLKYIEGRATPHTEPFPTQVAHVAP